MKIAWEIVFVLQVLKNNLFASMNLIFGSVLFYSQSHAKLIKSVDWINIIYIANELDAFFESIVKVIMVFIFSQKCVAVCHCLQYKCFF